MRPRVGIAAAGAIVIAVAAYVVAVPDSPERRVPPSAGPTDAPTAPPEPRHARFNGVKEECSTRSEANFPGAFTDPRNLVVGPLVLIGGAHTDAATVREFGGNKFPLLVEAGHVVTVRIAQQARRGAGLAYGPLPQGRETRLRDTHRSVTFIACRPGKVPTRYSPDGPSGSSADGTAVTFWSGFVLTSAPACIPLEVYIDAAASPRRIGLSLGRQCVRSRLLRIVIPPAPQRALCGGTPARISPCFGVDRPT